MIAAWSFAHPTQRDKWAMTLDAQEQTKIKNCTDLKGIPSVTFHAFGFPKEQLVRCDFPPLK